MEESRCSKTKGLFTAARARRIHPILPEAFRTADSFGVRLPNDPEYFPATLKQPARPGKTMRIVMKDGVWKTLAA